MAAVPSEGTTRWVLTTSGRWFLLVIALAFMTSYGLGYSLLFLLASFFVAILFYNYLFLRFLFPKCQLELTPIGELFVGRQTDILLSLDLTNSRFSPTLLEVQVTGKGYQSSSLLVRKAKSRQVRELHLPINPEQRGWAGIDHLTVSCGYPFGLLERRQLHLADQRILVYPRLIENLPEALFGLRYRQGLQHRASDDFQYLTEYREGDDVRMIHWKKSTLSEHPVLKRDLVAPEITEPHVFIPDPCPHFEYALSAITTMIEEDANLSNWSILTPQGPRKLASRTDLLRALALATPLAPQYLPDSPPAHAIYASHIHPPTQSKDGANQENSSHAVA